MSYAIEKQEQVVTQELPVVICDGPSCTERLIRHDGTDGSGARFLAALRSAWWQLDLPGTHPGGDHEAARHFHSLECLQRWAAFILATPGAIQTEHVIVSETSEV